MNENFLLVFFSDQAVGKMFEAADVGESLVPRRDADDGPLRRTSL
jgi:hypothetical protein